MSRVMAEDVRSFVLTRLAGPLRAKGLTVQDVPDDFDLLTEGVIDSFGIVELISSVLEAFGSDVDFEGLNAEDLTIIGSFCRYVAEKSVPVNRQ